jgi:WD40 repeat protein
MRARPWVFASVLTLLAATGVRPLPAQGAITKIKKAIGQLPKAPKVPTPTPGAPAAGAAATPTAPTGQPLNAKVKETLMGPTLASPGVSARTYMSEDGDHLAMVIAKGSRQAVLLDGVEGPVFDEIPTIFLGMVSVAVQWSPTGGHSAYLGRRGGDLIAVIDGKEAVTVATSQTSTVSGSMGWTFWFNHDGSHLAYGGRDGQNWVMVVDGAKSSPYREIDFKQTQLNGKRLVYLAQTADQQWHVVVDGKPGPAYGGIQSLQLTPDGLHYAYIGQSGPQSVAVVDGVESKGAGLGVSYLELAPDGRFAYIAQTKGPTYQDRGGEASLFVGGQNQAASCGTKAGISPCQTFTTAIGMAAANSSPQVHVAWSPDGKRFAYVQSNMPNPGVTVMVNGKPSGPTYGQAGPLMWSPDGSHFAFVGTNGSTGSFVVVDGEELPSYGNITEFRWSPDGKRYGFTGYGGGKGFTVVVDGKEQPKAQGYGGGSFRWSPDGKHFAYGAQTSITSFGAVVDGEVKPGILESFFAVNTVQPQITFPQLVFSPDANHLAYVGRNLDATGRPDGKAAVIVDGVRYEGPMQSYTFPSFSPDSKHFATMITTGHGWVVMIDGKVSSSYEDMLKAPIAAFRFIDAHTLRFYGIKSGQIYRVTLDIG